MQTENLSAAMESPPKPNETLRKAWADYHAPCVTLPTNKTPHGGKSRHTGTSTADHERHTEKDPIHKPKPPPGKTANGKKKPPRKPAPKKPLVSPSDLKARELNDRLNGLPVWLNFRPLAIGIDKDVFRLVNDECFPGASKAVVKKTLAMHAKHGRYLDAITQGDARYRLDGTEEGEINDFQRQLAADTLAARLQAKV